MTKGQVKNLKGHVVCGCGVGSGPGVGLDPSSDSSWLWMIRKSNDSLQPSAEKK